MTRDPLDPERHADAIHRLRELHRDATSEEQPRVALLLGLAIADYVAMLPDGEDRRGMAAEAVSRLDEAGDTSPATEAAKARLTSLPPLSQGPDSFEMGGGDLDWDVDWEALRGPNEAARNMTAILPMLAAMLPPDDPMRHSIADITRMLGVVDSGQWTPAGDAALASAIRGGALGEGVGLMLRIIAMTNRTRRCMLAERQGLRPDWPPIAELDALIGEIASAGGEFSGSFEGPFQSMSGLEHFYFASLIMMRLLVDIKTPEVRRDSAWRDNMLRLLGQVDQHLGKTPPAQAGLVMQLRSQHAKMFADLSQMKVRPSAPPSPMPASPAPMAPSGPAPVADPAPPDPPDPVEAADAGLADVFDGSHISPFTLRGPLSQLTSPELAAGLRIWAQFSDNSSITALAHLTVVLQATFAGRWTAEAEQDQHALRQLAADLDGAEGTTLADRSQVAGILAMSRAARWRLMSQSPRLAERPSAGETAELLGEVESAIELMSEAAAQYPSMVTFTQLQAFLHAEAASLLTELGGMASDTPDAGMIDRAREHMTQVPTATIEQLPPIAGDVFALQRIVADGIPPDPAEAERLARRFGELIETTAASLTPVEAAATAARQSQDVAAIGTALDELNKVGITLPAGSPVHARRLILLAEMQTLLAARATYPLGLVDAAGSAIEAARVASEATQTRAIARQLLIIFTLMTIRGQREGPFDQAEECLRVMLSQAGTDDWPLSVIATTGMAAAASLRAAALDDQDLHDVAVRLVADAEKLLPAAAPTDDWYTVARMLYMWTTSQALHGPDIDVVPVSLRLSDLLESFLASHQENGAETVADGILSASDGSFPEEQQTLRESRARLLGLAKRNDEPAEPQSAARSESGTGEQDGQSPGSSAAAGPDAVARTAQEARRLARGSLDRSAIVLGGAAPDGRSRRPLATAGKPEPAALRAAMADLHTTLLSPVLDTGLRRMVEEALGCCEAELYWADPDARTIPTLREAIVHLNRALTSCAPALPTTERADLLEVLARCRQEVTLLHEDEGERARARTEADRAARAAVRELARCVLLAGDTGQALEVAARANEVVARSIGWCLADGQDRAAIEMAESGRGLVLASVVLAGRVEEVLRGAGKDDLADGWRQGSEQGKIAALNSLWSTNAALLAAPTADQVSFMLAGTGFDAVIYLVPPAAADDGPRHDTTAPADLPGHAVLVRPLLSTIEVLSLPGLDDQGSGPLRAYLAALDDALTAFDTVVPGEEGFRGGPGGPAWADALVALGSWAYDRIMGPLTEHLRGWNLDHRPHVALIPLGELAAIPYATAWTLEATGSRRYAIDDVALTYAASARLLGEVSQRQPQQLSRRVVLVTDPAGGFPMTRRAARLLASHQYPEAEVYGLRSAPNGPATTEVLLGALPGKDQLGASLFQMSTHGTTEPARLRAYGGWLEISSILEQARDRLPDSPGGMVITNACLTDATRANYDESLTLATAFLAAGATAVIGTRWPVDDDTTAALSLRLHYHLHVGRSPAEALRRAQLDLLRPGPDVRRSLGPHLAAIEESRLSHPASWAGYVHHGSGAQAAAASRSAHHGS